MIRHLLNPLDFSVEEIDALLDLSDDIQKRPEAYAHVCDGKKLATCFYEPSTRTRLSFESAMLRLGGSIMGFQSANSSSAAKGESVADTSRVISCYADIMAMRHPKEGAPLVASRVATIPVINAGDGGHQHPTQTLTDLLTIRSLKGRIHFAHVRNLKFNAPDDFEEAAHLSSDGTFDMYEIMKALYEIGFDGPIRPDHGRMIWGEKAMPGYGLYDRALGAAYINGLWEAIEKNDRRQRYE